MPSSLWHYEFIANLLQGLYKNTTSWGVGSRVQFQDKNANKLRSFLQVPSGRRLANFVRPESSLPRTTKDKPACCCMLNIDGNFFFSRTQKCYLWHSWAQDPKDSKINPLVQGHKHQANREPSLIVSVCHVSWSIMGLLALTRQKQLA